MPTILIVEDDPAIAEGLEATLVPEHHTVLTARTGEEGLAAAGAQPIDLVILDLLLPDCRGEDVCRRLRAAGNRVPVLMLTSKSSEMDKVIGLESGADDYVTKPFGVHELLARVRALLRRAAPPQQEADIVPVGDVLVDLRKKEATRHDTPLPLSAKEFNLLAYLILHEGEVISRNALLDEVWGYDAMPVTRTVDNYILSLRKKIEPDPAHPVHILTVPTAGYRFRR